MNFENTEELKCLVNKIIDLFFNVGDIEKSLNNELKEKEAIEQDLLHELEMADLNAIDMMRVATRMKNNRKERRAIKDELLLISTIKGYTNKFTEKGIIAESQQLLKNINMYEKNLETRKYTPKVLENLKCAKRNDE